MQESPTPVVPPASRTQVVLWWIATIITLVVLDDLTFGPAFWLVSRTAGPWWAVLAVLATYIPVQVFVVRRGTAEHPGPLAAFLLRRLDLQRRSPRLRHNEHRIRSEVVGGFSAIVLSPIIGGVLPPMILFRRGQPLRFVRKLSVLTATVYAATFAILHGLVPSLI